MALDQDWNGWTALHTAAAHGRVAACAAILGCAQFRAATARDRDGMTALHLATARGHGAICRSMLQHEAFRRTACVAPWAPGTCGQRLRGPFRPHGARGERPGALKGSRLPAPRP